MKGLLIKGGKRLSGTVVPQGSKNAALPMIFASILMHGTSTLYGVPDITDVRVAIEIISRLGAVCTFSEGTLYINTDNLCYEETPVSLTSKIRASSYLLGASLSRFGRVHPCSFGGCNFEHRPIDMHLYAASRLGAVIGEDVITCARLLGADVYFDKVSVGATVNALLLAVSADGESRIYNFAREPHIFALIDFLRSAGAKISVRPDFLLVSGRKLSSGSATIIPDMIEAGTYLAISLATDSSVSVKGYPTGELVPFLGSLTDAGAVTSYDEGKITVSGFMQNPCNVITSPYPGFPTDLQPQTAPLMARHSGGVICERVWLSRFGYLESLKSFGIKYDRFASTVRIYPSTFRPASVTAIDLRAGASLIIAALAADGESFIGDAEVVYRGYENIVKKLRALGADIKETP